MKASLQKVEPMSAPQLAWGHLLPEISLAVGALTLVLLMKAFGVKNTAKLANARAASHKEIQNARKIGLNQIKSFRRGQLTDICLTIGTPGKPDTIYVPNSEEGIVVCGAPGKGKTYSCIDRLIQSALDRGFPMLLYDFKGSQMQLHAPYAAMKGYQVYVFAPGKDYSCKVNLLDFLRSGEDTLMARQLAEVINKNTKKNADNDNPFFSESGDLLLQSIFMLAKGSPYPDLPMAWNILSLPNLSQKLLQADALEVLPMWASIGASVLMASAEAAETEGGIKATGMTVFARFLNAQFLPCLMGKTTMPLDVKGKTLIIFQTDKETRDVVSPLIATVLHLLIARNFATDTDREDPLVLAADEFPTLYLPDIVNWINEFRSAGFVPILGYQFNSQIEGRYGENASKSIVGGCATKFIYNPQDLTTAEKYAAYCGEIEIKTKSESRSYGKDGHRSESFQGQKVKLFEVSDILRLPKGKAIFINPAYGNAKESAMPQALKVKVPEEDVKKIKVCQGLWSKVKLNLVKRAKEVAKTRNEVYDDAWALKVMRTRKTFAGEILLPSVFQEDMEALDKMTPFSESEISKAL